MNILNRLMLRSENLIIYGSLTQDFCSFARRSNRRIVSYATIVTTRKTDKKTSQDPEIIKFSLLSSEDAKISAPDLSFDSTAALEKQLPSQLCACFPNTIMKLKSCAIHLDIIKSSLLIASLLIAMLFLTGCGGGQTSVGYTVYEGYNYPNYGYYYGRGLYNRPAGYGGGGPTEPPDPRPALPVNKAK